MEAQLQAYYEFAGLFKLYMHKQNTMLAKFQLSNPSWSIMHVLMHHGPQTVSHLSVLKNVEKPSISRVVQLLVELGYVECLSGEDKRVKMVALTEKGTQVGKVLHEELGKFQLKLLTGVSEEDQAVVIRVLQSIKKELLKDKE